MIIKRIQTNMRKMTIAFAAFVVALSGVAMLNTASASALSGTCASNGFSYRASYPMRNPRTGAQTGSLQIYYKGSTGQNCAMAQCVGSTCGTLYREVAIKLHTQANYNDAGYDAGWFSSYAGPVVTGNARGKCIDAYAQFSIGESNDLAGYYGSRSLKNVHCG